MDGGDLFYLTDDDPAVDASSAATPWLVAVIDDDPAVHEATRFALRDYVLAGRRLSILSAHSAHEGRRLIAETGSVAVILLDVVMETDEAGLELVDFIRKELRNETIRIILRTGQPGQAPERRVVVEYDINDYKAKTELTAERLFTTLTAALRSYEQLQRLEEARCELAQANAQLEARVLERTAALQRANEHLAQQRADLRRANRFKAEIMGTIAHDLKNPLSIILGRTEMLRELMAEHPLPMEAMRGQIEHVRASAGRLVGMVDALVTDAMNDALDITLRREPLDFTALVAEVIATNGVLAERKEQKILFEDAGPLPVHGDEDRLREAVDNLLSNAIKYGPIAGRIEVAVARERNEVVCRVRDDGPGLSPEDIPRLFERFQRLSARPTGGETSTGLGLSIVRRIVELHGGRVFAESPGPGLGSTFSLHLPFEERADRS